MLRQLNESIKHGIAAGDAAKPPERADWTVDQNWEKYTAADHGVWKTLFERQSRLLPGRACNSFIRGMGELQIGADTWPGVVCSAMERPLPQGLSRLRLTSIGSCVAPDLPTFR